MAGQMDRGTLVEALTALGALLDGGRPYDFVVIGGASLLLRSWVERATIDVDVLGRLDAGAVELANPLPDEVVEAVAMVARSIRGLVPDWFGDERTAGLLDSPLPTGFVERLEVMRFGPGLRLHLASRRDVIALKLFAATVLGAADRASKHLHDLRKLEPSVGELSVAQAWVVEQIPSGDAQLRDLDAIVRELGAR